VARRLAGFRAALLYCDSEPLSPDQEDALRLQRTTREDLLARSDFVVLCLPLTADTRHLVDRDFLARLKPGAVLVNTARGSLVDEAAIADALATGALGGYAADTFAMEDWALADRPREVDARLRDAPEKTLFTPHLGSAVDRIRREIALQAAASVLEALGGEVPAGAINRIGQPRPALLP
jgi:phosphonate dehydrogenase